MARPRARGGRPGLRGGGVSPRRVLPRRAPEAWSGVLVAGVVVLAVAVLADAFGEPPRGGPRWWAGLGLGTVLVALGYALRCWQARVRGRGGSSEEAPCATTCSSREGT